ncbi:MAG: hypothetical protein U0531_13760 [Dehalococcoidia bacterium]
MPIVAQFHLQLRDVGVARLEPPGGHGGEPGPTTSSTCASTAPPWRAAGHQRSTLPDVAPPTLVEMEAFDWEEGAGMLSSSRPLSWRRLRRLARGRWNPARTWRPWPASAVLISTVAGRHHLTTPATVAAEQRPVESSAGGRRRTRPTRRARRG